MWNQVVLNGFQAKIYLQPAKIFLLFHFILKSKYHLTMELNGVFKPKLLNNPFASFSQKLFDFLLPHAAHFDDENDLPF